MTVLAEHQSSIDGSWTTQMANQEPRIIQTNSERDRGGSAAQRPNFPMPRRNDRPTDPPGGWQKDQWGTEGEQRGEDGGEREGGGGGGGGGGGESGNKKRRHRL